MDLKGKLWLSHVGFYVTDINKMVDFYTRFLGFTVSDRGPRPELGWCISRLLFESAR